jgi:hypothetical protein
MARKRMPERQIDELLESWINGNRKLVVNELFWSKRSDLLRFAFTLHASQGDGDVRTLINLIDGRD